MKTVKEWFELIKDEKIRKEVFENMTPEWSDKEFESVNEAIIEGFKWRRTPQGYAYWDIIHDSNIELLEDQPSPSPIIETFKQMNTEELIKRIETLEQTFKKMLNQITFEVDEMTESQPQERKLIMSIDALETLGENNAKWWEKNKAMLEMFGRLKLIEQQWNEGKSFDWEDDDDKYCLYLYGNKWENAIFCASNKIFNFHKKEHAELFLKTFAKELDIIKPLFS